MSGRVLGIGILIAILFVAGCTTSGNGEAQLAVATLAGGIPAGSVSVGGGAYPSTQLAASGGTAPYKWTTTTGSLPTGVTLSSAGMISGSPTTAGTFTFTVQVTDSATPAAHSASANFSITVNPQLAITTTGTLSATGEAGAVFPTTALAETGGVGPFTWVINSGNLPGALSLSSAGSISGTISASTVPGTFNFTAKVTDSQGDAVVSGTLSIKVDPALVITPPAFPTGIASVAYPAETFTASGGSGSGYTFALASGTLPSPLTLGANGTIASAVPTTPGTSTFTVKVTDSLGFTTTTGSLSITVNGALAITPPTFPTGIVGAAYPAKTFTASGGSGSGYTFALASGALPNPLTLGANGTIASATPTAAGTSTFTVKVTDSLGNTVTSSSLSITVDPALVITSPTFPTGVVGASYPAKTFTATGGSGSGYTFTLASGSLPSPLSLGANGTIASATPTAAGTSTFTVKVTDSLGFTTTTNSLSIVVDPALLITPPTFPTGVVNVSYPAQTFTATGGSGSGYTFTLASGSLPTPLTLGANGTIATGTPTTAGTSTFTVKVTDSLGFTTTSTSLSITINGPLTITPPSFPTGIVGAAYPAKTFTASGGSGSGYTFTLASGALPTPLTLGANGTIASATPTAAGTSTFTVKVTDSFGDTTTSNSLSITVDPALVITPPSFPTGIVGISYPAETFTATGGSGSGYTFALVSGTLPNPLVLGANGTIASATPTAAGTSTFTVKVTDSLGFTTTTGSLSITINGALAITPPSFPSGVVSVAYPAETFTASGGSGTGYTFTLASGSLPNPLTLGANGTIASATPTAAGTSTFTVKVTDSLGNTATTSSLSITINLSLAITPPTFPTGVVGASYPTETFTATGGSGTGYTFTLASGALPTPLTLGTNGTIASSSPTASGTFNFTVKVTDSLGNTATTSGLSIIVDSALVITPPTFPVGIIGTSYPAETFTASGGSGSGYTFTLASGSLPNPFALGANGTIASATPTAVGVSTFTVKVTDSLGFTTTTTSLSITINGVLAITPPTFPGGVVGTSYPAETFTASGGSGSGYTFTLASGSLPNPLTLGTNGTIATGVPTAAGTSTFTVKVTDSLGNTATTGSLSITITVPSCTTNCTISGTVTGPWVSGVTVNLTGPASASTTTNASGFYSFTGLAGGSYTVTPSLAGYTYSPVAPLVATSGSTTTQNFVAASAISSPSYSISGTVSGSSASGIVYIRVFNCGGGTNCNTAAGTTLASISTNNGAYTVRGLSPGNNYSVSAEIDTLGTGAPNEANPLGSISGININSANVTGANIIVSGQTILAPVTPNKPTVFASSGAAFISYKQPRDNNGEEIATSYRIYRGTDTAASNLGFVTIPAGDSNNVFVLSGLTNGTAYYFKMSALNANPESAPSPVFGPVTINPTSGSNTVSGSVTITGITPPAGSALYVGMFSNTSGVYFERIANPSNSQPYSVSGITSGTYQEFAVLDVAGTGFVGVGDVTNFGSNGPPSLAVNSSISGNNIALVAVSARTFVATNHQRSGITDSYGINLSEDVGTKRPVSMTLFSGNNVAVPFDMTAERNNSFQPIFDNTVRPLSTDTYQFLVTFSDGTTQIISNTGLTVLDSFAQNLAMNTPVNSTSLTPTNVPMLNWSAPASPPAFYSYSVGLSNADNAQENWNYNGGNNSNGIPSTQLFVMFDTDGSANPSSSLTTGTTYNWWVQVRDDNGNQAQITTTYKP